MITVKTVILVLVFIYTSRKCYQSYKYDKKSRISNRLSFSEYFFVVVYSILFAYSMFCIGWSNVDEDGGDAIWRAPFEMERSRLEIAKFWIIHWLIATNVTDDICTETAHNSTNFWNKRTSFKWPPATDHWLSFNHFCIETNRVVMAALANALLDLLFENRYVCNKKRFTRKQIGSFFIVI